MDNLFFEQLVQRIEGDQKALNEASDLFRGMIDRKIWKQLTRQKEIPKEHRMKRLHFGGMGRKYRIIIETAAGVTAPWRIVGGLQLVVETDPD